MAVYFIQAGDSGPRKIGWAADIHRRLYALQTANHEELRLLGSIDAERSHELALKRHFRSSHIRGEWFSISPSDVEKILTANINDLADGRSDVPEQDIVRIGAGLGCSARQMAAWFERGRTMPMAWQKAIEAEYALRSFEST